MYLKKLREIRESKNLTQQEVANNLSVSVGTYSMNEEGHDCITIDNLVKFCDYFNVSIDYIFELSNNYNYKSPKNYFNREILSVRLKEFRKENNLTQVKVGKLLNIDHSVWCRYEQNKTVIKLPFLYTICHKYNISADYLLGKTDSPKYLK